MISKSILDKYDGFYYHTVRKYNCSLFAEYGTEIVLVSHSWYKPNKKFYFIDEVTYNAENYTETWKKPSYVLDTIQDLKNHYSGGS